MGFQQLTDEQIRTWSIEQKDRWWFENVYQGNVPQLTLRAVLMGGVLGMFMSISNLYTTLKLGWSFGVAVTACVLSFVIWNFFRLVSGNRLSQMTILENNCMQSTASAAGYSTGTTVGTAFGALLMLTNEHVAWYMLLPFVFFVAALGVFLAIPMKRQMINIEQLAFPSGIAAAETLRSLYSQGAEALRKAYSLVAALVVAVVVGLLRAPEGGLKIIERLHKSVFQIPETIPFGGTIGGIECGRLIGFGFEPSLVLIGAGMIIGLRVTLSMLIGAAILYLFVGPRMISMDVANTGVAGYVNSIPVIGDGLYHLPRWALWGGTSTMVFSSLTSLAVQWRTLVRSFTSFRKRNERSTELADMAAIEVPISWLVGGLIPIGLGMIIVQHFAFNISFLLGTIAVVLAFLIAMVCCRATGETDTTPIGPLGKVTQLVYALLAQGNTTVNLMSAGCTAGAGGSAADLLTDLKSGYLLGANPRRQFIAQFVGCFFGTIAIVPAWYMMVPDKAALEKFNPPATNMWRAVAEALTKGLDSLPMTARYAIVIGAFVGIVLPLLVALFPKAAPYLPSAMGLGLSWAFVWTNSFSFFIGGLIVWTWHKLSRRSGETYAIPIASGFIAGESLTLAIIAICTTAVGLLAAYKP